MVKFFKIFIIPLFYIIIGTSVVLTIIYTRLFREILPKALPQHLIHSGNYIIIATYVWIIVVWLYIFIKIIRCILYENFNIGKTSQTNRIVIKIQKIYDNSMFYFHDRVIDSNFPFSTEYHNFIKGTLRFIMLNFNTTRRLFILILILNITPKLIVVFAFFVDVIIYKEFRYVYKFGLLLCLPLIERYLVFYAQCCTQNNIIEMNAVMLYWKFYPNNINEAHDLYREFEIWVNLEIKRALIEYDYAIIPDDFLNIIPENHTIALTEKIRKQCNSFAHSEEILQIFLCLFFDPFGLIVLYNMFYRTVRANIEKYFKLLHALYQVIIWIYILYITF